MFPASSSIDITHYDFMSRDNESKWKGLFINGLKKMSSYKVGISHRAKEDAFDYLEKLILQLLGMICSKPYPHNVQDTQDRVLKIFPPPIDKWAIDEAMSAIKQGKKKTDHVFPIDKIHTLLKEVLLHKIELNTSIFITSVLEYIAADILQLVGNYVKNWRIHGEYSTQDMKAALSCDKLLCDLFKLGDNFSVTVVDEHLIRNSLSYNEVVFEFLSSERQYLRDLQMLIKVFREQLANQLETQDMEIVFSQIEDITELTITLISTVEDTLEMTEPNQLSSIGSVFLELAENMEFEVYELYAKSFNEECRKNLENLLNRPDIEAKVSTAGQGFVEAVKFYFPKLLLEPFYHCLQYFDYIKLLTRLSESEKDKTEFEQAESILSSLKIVLEGHIPNIPKKIIGDITGRISGKGNKQIAQQKVLDIKAQVEGFNESIVLSYFNEFFFEGELQKIGTGRRPPSERHAYLFDGILFLCKPNYRRSNIVVPVGILTQLEYRLKETFYMTKFEVRDKEDSDEYKNLFGILPRDQPPVILSARSAEEKSNWMAALVMLTTKSMLDRILDRYLLEEEKKHPLRLPSKEDYKFAVPDSDDNIVFDKDNGNHLIIKGATLLKLIERLTHHQYYDHSFINTFLTTYRSFCSPNEFLDLLIYRFDIPDPRPFRNEEIETIHTREMLKRFRKEYVRLVRLRVLNVIKQWVIHHFYDFERDSALQFRLEDFLSNNDEHGGRSNSIFESVRKVLRKAIENSCKEEFERNLTDNRSPPPIEYHIRCSMNEFSVLTLHPIELARQLTILEFDLYRVVKPSELVGSVWTKKDKDKSSPNLLRMIKHTTAVTRWFEKTIVDAENLEERIAIVSRILEIMIVLQDLNNFNGVLAVVSAMGSASVHRLSHTFTGVKSISPRLIKALEEAQELQNDHYRKYQERLRSINPPCVPFFGMYLTNILLIEEGNLDFLPNSNNELINFAKRRRVAEITSEIRQFQYSHYCLAVEQRIREFIENLKPFDSDINENEISNYLYEKSLEIEPRGAKQLPKFPRKWPDLNLKSPGIKKGKNHPAPLLIFSNSTTSLSLLSSPSRTTLDSELDSIIETPTSNSSSNTNTPTGAHHDFSIFAPVLIGAQKSPSPHVLTPPIILQNVPTIPISYPPPPPLPPRKKHGSVGDSPKDEHPLPPPPLPPRKSPRTPNPPIPRRNSSSLSNHDTSPSCSRPPLSLLSPTRSSHSHTTTSSNGPSLVQSPSESSHNAFSFHHQHIMATPLSPERVPIPPKSNNNSSSIAPQLPPKSIRSLNNNNNNNNN